MTPELDMLLMLEIPTQTRLLMKVSHQVELLEVLFSQFKGALKQVRE